MRSRASIRLLVAALGLHVAAACGPEVPAENGPVSPDPFEGDAPGECTDGADADQDGLADCADPGCSGTPGCSGSVSAPGGAVERLHLCGRFDQSDPEELRFEWSGTTLGARISGTGVRVTLDTTGWNVFEVLIDGVAAPPLETEWGLRTYDLATGLPSGEHDVLLVRRTEAFMGRVAFVRFHVVDGKVVRSPSPWTRGLEFVGDSVTAGYGALGAGPACTFSAETESAWVSFASVAARELGACAHLIAWSGKGVYQNYGGDATEPMPVLYPRILPTEPGDTWHFSDPIDAVVIRLGTNDFSAPLDEGAFEAAYADLLRLVRDRRPGARILCIGGEFLGATPAEHVRNAVSAVGDPNVRLLELPAPDPATEGWGCDFHPSAASHARIGGVLADLLRADLGW